MTRFYYTAILCKNCGHKETMAIEKGVTIFDELYNKKCPNCGCTTLKQDYLGSMKNGEQF